MKKTIFKTTLFIVCIGIILFLLLPFLETSTPSQEGINAKAEPQIFTSNPLTALLQKLSPFFRLRAHQEKKATLNPRQIDEMFGKPKDGALASAKPLSQNVSAGKEADDSVQKTDTSTPVSDEADNPASSNQKGNEDWVLIRQTNPTASKLGMHEINVKDNPYESYIRQQKNAAHIPDTTPTAFTLNTPAASTPSRFQKLIDPVKRFFGFGDAQQLQAASFGATKSSGEGAAQLAAAKGLNNGLIQTGASSIRGPIDPSLPSFNPAISNSGEIAPHDVMQDMREVYYRLHPESLIESAVQALADAKFPGALSEKQQEKKDQFIHEKASALWSQLQDFQKKRMDIYYDDMPLHEKFQEACKNESLPLSNSCEFPPLPRREKPESSVSQEELKAVQQINQAKFESIAQLPLPQVPLTPVLSRASSAIQISPDSEESRTSPFLPEAVKANPVQNNRREIQIVNDLYNWMFDEANCAEEGSECYYVANSAQPDSTLKDVFHMMTSSFVGDPNNLYPKGEAAYIQHRLDKLGENASEEARKKEEEKARSDYQKYAPPYLIYNKENMQQHYQQLGQVVRSGVRADNTSFFFMMNGTQASSLSDTLNGTGFLYDTDPILLQEKSKTPAEVSNHFVKSSAELMRDSWNAAAEVIAPLASEATKIRVGDAITEYNNLLEDNGNDALGAFFQILQKQKGDQK